MGCSATAAVAPRRKPDTELQLTHEPCQTQRQTNTGRFKEILLGWKFEREIGKGGMSRVYRVTNIETNETCAAKVYDKAFISTPTLGNEESPLKAVKTEVEIMAALQHRYILPIVEVIEDDVTNSLIILTPFADRGTLENFIEEEGTISEQTLSICFHQVAEAMKYLHELNIVHRDIKPDNILCLSDTFFVVSDFSVSTALTSHSEKLLDTHGSPAFLSPEECSKEPFLPKPGDVWSYGVALYSSYFRRLPFSLDEAQGETSTTTMFAVAERLQTRELEFPSDTEASDALKSFLRWILQKDAGKRPTFSEIVEHEWFEKAREVDRMNIEEEKRDWM